MIPSHRARSLILIALGHFVIELCCNFLPVIYPPLMRTLGLTYTQVGMLALVAGVGTTLMQPLFGYLSDRWNPRQMSALSVAWTGLIMGLVGAMNSYLVVMLVIGLAVLGSAAFHPSGVSIVSTFKKTQRGRAASVFSVGGNLGAALSPMFVTLGIGWMGTRGTTIVIPLALAYGLILYKYLDKLTAHPSDQPTTSPSAPPMQVGNIVSLALIVLAVMCMAWFHHSMRTYLPMWLESQGYTLATSGQMLFVYLAATGIGSLIGGTVSDRMGRWQLFAICIGLLGPATWFFITAGPMGQWILLAVMGLFIGALFPISIVLAQETWTQGVGIASGLVMGLGWVPGGIGASFTGWVADQATLTTGLQLLVIPTILGAVLILGYAALQSR